MPELGTETDRYIEWHMMDLIVVTPPAARDNRQDFLIGVYMDDESIVFRWTQERLKLEVARGTVHVIDDEPERHSLANHIATECKLLLNGTSPKPDCGTAVLHVTCGCEAEEKGHQFEIYVAAAKFYEADGTEIKPP